MFSSTWDTNSYSYGDTYRNDCLHQQQRTIFNGGGEAARQAYCWDQLNGQTGAGESHRHQGAGSGGATGYAGYAPAYPAIPTGVRGTGAGASSNEAYTSASKPKTTARHGGRPVDEGARTAYYHEHLHRQTATSGNKKGGGARGGGGTVRNEGYRYYGYDDDDNSESEEDGDDSDEDEKEISRGKGGVRGYDNQASKPEKKGAGGYHDVGQHYYGYGEFRNGARARWQDECYPGYGVLAYGDKHKRGGSVVHDTAAPP